MSKFFFPAFTDLPAILSLFGSLELTKYRSHTHLIWRPTRVKGDPYHFFCGEKGEGFAQRQEKTEQDNKLKKLFRGWQTYQRSEG